MIWCQRLDTEHIQYIMQEKRIFLELRNKRIFEGTWDETVKLIHADLQKEISAYEQRHGISFETGRALSPASGSESPGAGNPTGNAYNIFA